MKFPHQVPSASLVLLALSAWATTLPLRAQTPAAAPATDPGQKNVPAEIVPTKPATPPASGQKVVETTTPTTALSPGTKAGAEADASPARQAVDTLTESELDKVMTLIRQRYISPSALSDAAVKRATVQGLMERLGASATLVLPGGAQKKEASPFRPEILNENVGYLRLGSFDVSNLVELDRALAHFAEKGVTALIVDVRATPASGDFEQAAEVCRRFCPKGKVLFTLKRQEEAQAQRFTTEDEPKAKGLLTVLTNAATEGSAEVVAGTLRALAGAVVIGQKTKGAAAEFADLPLEDGRFLRLAVAEVLLPGDLSVVPEGLKPDVPVENSLEDEKSVLALELEKGISSYVLETERTRLNEAALVAGTNPDLDAAQAAQAARGQRPKSAVRDPILQRAVDLITSVAIFQKGATKKR